ncbi:MAG TPA: chemotaxis protein CheB [Thermoanaerobaculia bacterium]|nr:chemotaxis protein CheB [Thermoanaerobaculia bacterium]
MATTRAKKKATAVPPPELPPSDLAPDDALGSYATSIFPIVGIGASAGGLEAFSELIRALPEKPGMAFIFVQHQEPKHASMLAEIVQRLTKMPVQTITDDTRVAVDNIYLAPAASHLLVTGGAIRLVEDQGGASSMPIDHFFASLAEDQGSRAIGVVLSGAASDGALGAKAIKAEGGITFAQDESAKIDGMPRSAIVAGSIDFVLPPKDIARELLRIARHSYMSVTGGAGTPLPDAQLNKIFGLLQQSHDVDFTHYKPTTVQRRIRRRMALNKIDELADYLEVLRSNPVELAALYNDILIRVTGFFRDKEVFDALRRVIFPAMLEKRVGGQPLRIWVPGCATGEEVYSMAISILDYHSTLGVDCPVQIFGTDVNEGAVEHARAGVYSDGALADVPPELVRRYFAQVNGNWRVTKTVRDCCVFARQNLTKDPPFSKLDMISCRNVMIYLGAALQRKAMSLFHYALRANGYLVLGSSETIGNFSDLFAVVDRKHKVFEKKSSTTPVIAEFELTPPAERVARARVIEDVTQVPSVFREADRVALARFAPAGVLINDAMEILQFRGRTSPFLEPAPGTASFNVLKMAREGLLAELRAAIHAARKTEAPVRREGIRIRKDGGAISVNLEVLPFVAPGRERYYLVLFEELPFDEKAAKGRKTKETKAESGQSSRLKRELESTREYLQSIIEEQEAMNEELRSANEEIQSSNEELQSTNEELETAKEELQSSNEELTTLNEELENRNNELALLNNDLLNILTSVDIPIVMLDGGLRIRRFNPGAQRVLNLVPADIGRSISDIKLTLRLEKLEEMITGVIDDFHVRELDVQDRAGRWYSLRIRPYKTMENKIEGAVLVLIAMEAKKALLEVLS